MGRGAYGDGRGPSGGQQRGLGRGSDRRQRTGQREDRGGDNQDA
jgi:hypothetical protein